MVQLSNNTTIINPSVLGANREANILCPKVIIEDIELTLTLKLLETKLYNLCLEQNSFKLLVSDLFIAELMGRKERTARNYINKLIKLGKIKKVLCKEKGKYYIVFNYAEWMKLNDNETITIDENFNVVLNSLPQEAATLLSTVDFSAVPAMGEPTTASTSITNANFINESVAEAPSPAPLATETHKVESTSLASIQFSETEEAENFYSELNENQQEDLSSLSVVVEENWLKNGKLAELKKDWLKSSKKDCWENFLTERILLQIKLDYAKELKEMLADDSLELHIDEAKNAAIFALASSYEESQLEQAEVLEQVEIKIGIGYLLEAVGQSHPISFNEVAIGITNSNNKTELPSANSNNFSGAKALANSCQNAQNQGAQTQKSNFFDDKGNLANSCQKQDLALSNEEFVNNHQERIEQRRQHLLKGFENNQRQTFSLAKPSPTKPNQEWEQAGTVNNTLESIIETIIKNVELAKSCQSDAQLNETTTSLTKGELGNSLPNDSSSQSTPSNKNFGNSLPNDSSLQSAPSNKNLGNSLPNDTQISEPERSPTALYPKSLKPKKVLLKNYFWNIT